MLELPRIRVTPYIPEIPRSGRWVPRKSYQIGIKTAYPFDLEVASKRASVRPTGRLETFFRRLLGQKRVIAEDDFTLPSIEDFQGIYQEESSSPWTYTLPLPNPLKPPSQRSELLQVREKEALYEIPEKRRFLSAIQRIPLLKGALKRNSKGLFYIQFPKKLLNHLHPLLLKNGAVIPKFFHLKEDIGPHIPVILPHEDLIGFTEFDEIGEEFFLVIKNLWCQEISDWRGIKKIWFLTFESLDLEAIRMRYGLPAYLQGQDYHCIIGIEPGKAPPKASYCRINTTCTPA